MSGGQKRAQPTRLERARGTIEFVLLLIGIPTAVIAFAALFPQAWEFTHQRAHQYAALRSLHAGYTIEQFKIQLGESTLVRMNGELR